MTMRLPRYARLRASLFGVLATAALASACETPLPTSAEIETMDVAAVEARAGELALSGGGSTTYFVDGKQVTAEEARALDGARIERIEVTRAAVAASRTPARAGKIEIFTVITTPSDSSGRRTSVGADGRTRVLVNEMEPSVITTTTRTGVSTGTRVAEGTAVSEGTRIRIRGQNSRLETTRPTAGTSHQVTVRGTGSFEGLLLIDGVDTPVSAMTNLDPDTIQSVDVLKGGAAARAYSDPRAVNGVIRVTTKRGASTQ